MNKKTDKTLKDVSKKVKIGFRFINISKYGYGNYNFEVLKIVKRGVVAQLYSKDWSEAYKNHQHLVEWDAKIIEI